MVDGEISFGRFRFDPTRRELHRDNSRVRLGNRALDILCVLASAEGALVTKDELMAQVWPGVVVEENNLTSTSHPCARRSMRTAKAKAGL
jgi:DNA-binding winged helix-turn-helix (wHTH) protein